MSNIPALLGQDYTMARPVHTPGRRLCTRGIKEKKNKKVSDCGNSNNSGISASRRGSYTFLGFLCAFGLTAKLSTIRPVVLRRLFLKKICPLKNRSNFRCPILSFKGRDLSFFLLFTLIFLSKICFLVEFFMILD
jgi:hypothetical protein